MSDGSLTVTERLAVTADATRAGGGRSWHGTPIGAAAAATAKRLAPVDAIGGPCGSAVNTAPSRHRG